jgi:hypothetical protein
MYSQTRDRLRDNTRASHRTALLFPLIDAEQEATTMVDMMVMLPLSYRPNKRERYKGATHNQRQQQPTISVVPRVSLGEL